MTYDFKQDAYRALAVEFDIEKIQRFAGGHEIYLRVRALAEALWPEEEFVLDRVSGNAALYGGTFQGFIPSPLLNTLL